MPTESRRFLVVEDSPTMVQLYKMVLGGMEGAELVFAGNGKEGLDCMTQNPAFDLMIVDINMPEMDGLEFLSRVRNEMGIADIPAIVISTEAEDEDRQAAIRAGAADYLKKPWTPEELLATVDAALGRPAG